MSGRLASLNRAGKMNLPAVKQQFFGHGCFAGVRMRDDRKCAASFYFLCGRHATPLVKQSPAIILSAAPFVNVWRGKRTVPGMQGCG